MSTEIILGGREVVVTTAAGSPVSVTVRTLKIAELPQYFNLLEEDEALAAFLTGKDAEFISSLMPGSVLDIVDAGHDVNFPTARRWAERRASQIEALGPIARKVGLMSSPTSARTAG